MIFPYIVFKIGCICSDFRNQNFKIFRDFFPGSPKVSLSQVAPPQKKTTTTTTTHFAQLWYCLKCNSIVTRYVKLFNTPYSNFNIKRHYTNLEMHRPDWPKDCLYHHLYIHSRGHTCYTYFVLWHLKSKGHHFERRTFGSLVLMPRMHTSRWHSLFYRTNNHPIWRPCLPAMELLFQKYL